MKKEHSSRWRKLDNAAQAFPAATGKKDTRVFRFYCQLKEDIQADLLQKALEQTMEHYPVFSMVLRKGLFWFLSGAARSASKSRRGKASAVQ